MAASASSTDHHHQQQQQQQLPFRPPKVEFVKSLSALFGRDLISIPVIKKYPHLGLNQRCQLRAATLELDTSAHPNIEYIAGNRLSIYPLNPLDHVNSIMKHVVDDLEPAQFQQQQQQHRPASSASSTGLHQASITKRPKVNLPIHEDPLSKFVHLNGKDSLKLALAYVYDITAAPSRDLLRILAENCSNREQKNAILAICKSDETWEKWVCSSLRTLRSTLEEYNSCMLSAKSLLSELTLQQPRQYSISSIKSSKRFRAEIIVFQHKFSVKQIGITIQNIKEHELNQLQDLQQQQIDNPASQNTELSSQRSNKSIRSIRSVITFDTSPIKSQQVHRVPHFSGPLMSQYASASSTTNNSGRLTNFPSTQQVASSTTGATRMSKISSAPLSKSHIDHNSESSAAKQYDGLCSSYLLNLNSNDFILCEFVENPRFTLKGSRERPIIMIGQDVGVVAFRPFWQQRSLEHARAQTFYNLFKDLKPKKFGDMQLVCLTGNRCKVEDLFKREINAVIANKIMSSVSYINRNTLFSILESALKTANLSNSSSSNKAPRNLPIESKELLELGLRIARLLVENNGCLYTCCDTPMTQAIEILVVESVARLTSMPRDKIMTLLSKWKGRRMVEQPLINNQFLYTLENPFERAQIVQETYDYSL